VFRATHLTAGAATLVTILMLALAVEPLYRAVVDNWSAVRVLAAIPALDDSTTFWRGAGLRAGHEEIGILIARAYQASGVREGCTDRERAVLSAALTVLDDAAVRAPRTRMTQLAVARQIECTGSPSDALQLLAATPAPDSFDLQRVAFLQRLGARGRATDIVLRYVCASREPWCVWSVLGVAPAGGAGIDTPIWRHSNEAADGALLRRRIAPLDVQTIHNVVVERGAPLMVKGAAPLAQGDNYIQYQTIPVASGPVRFRIRGSVVGPAPSSCLHPRLVFWTSGKYDGELELPYPVRDLFEVDLWAAVPDRVTAVTPRVTFDSRCLSGGQTIAFGAAELASAAAVAPGDGGR
jgi:hypothetical protein